MSNNQLVTDKKYILPFGKYRGESIEDLMETYEGRQYLIWAHNNDEYLPFFELTGWLMDEIEDMI